MTEISKYLLVIMLLLAVSTVYADGNVKVTVKKHGDVELKGDAADNAVDIMAAGPGMIKLLGIATTLNGAPDPIVLSYSRNLKLKMGLGDDSISIKTDLPGGLAIHNKGGNDTTKVNHVASPRTTIHGDISLKGQHGDDWLKLNVVDIKGKVSVAAGDGTSFLGFYAAEVFGDVTMKSRRGDSSLGISTSLVRGNVKYEAGKGKNSDSFNLSSDGYVIGNVKVKLGDGEDHVTGVRLEIEGKAEFDLGAGADLFYTEGLQVGENLRIKSGNGLDVVIFESFHSFGFTRGSVGGNTRITGDGGDDAIVLESSDFAGDLSLDGGKGTDTLVRDDITVGGNEKVKNF